MVGEALAATLARAAGIEDCSGPMLAAGAKQRNGYEAHFHGTVE